MSLIVIFLVERSIKKENGFLVSKETVVLRWWGRSKQKFGLSNELTNAESPPRKTQKADASSASPPNPPRRQPNIHQLVRQNQTFIKTENLRRISQE